MRVRRFGLFNPNLPAPKDEQLEGLAATKARFRADRLRARLDEGLQRRAVAPDERERVIGHFLEGGGPSRGLAGRAASEFMAREGHRILATRSRAEEIEFEQMVALREIAKPFRIVGKVKDLVRPSDLLRSDVPELRAIGALHFGCGKDVRITRSVARQRAKQPSDLAKWNNRTWNRFATDLQKSEGIPEEVAGSIAHQLQAHAVEAFPTVALVARLPTPTVSAIEGMTPAAYTALAKQYPGLALSSLDPVTNRADATNAAERIHAVRDFLAVNSEVDFLTVSGSRLNDLPEGHTKAFIESYRQLYEIGGSATAALRLASYGIDSVFTPEPPEFPVHLPEELRRLKNTFDYIDESELARFHPSNYELPTTFDLPPQIAMRPQFEGLAKLFGGVSCKCEHCSSVLSQSAYFIDLMEYALTVEARAGVDSENAASLKQRRPDLWTSSLSCAAIQEEVPYLDLVNDVLRTAVESLPEAQRSPSSYAHRLNWPGFAELRHLDPLLEELGFQRVGMVRQTALGADPLAVAAARLRISLSEANAINVELSESDVTAVFKEIDLGTANANNDLDPIDMSALCRITGLKRGRLVECLTSTYVQGSRRPKIVGETTTGSRQNDKETLKGASFAVLERLVRVVRLLRVLEWLNEDWSIRELSYVLKGVFKGDQPLASFACFVRLKRALKLDVEQTCAFFGPIPDEPLVKKGLFSLARRLLGRIDGFLKPYGRVRERLAVALRSDAASTDAIFAAMSKPEGDDLTGSELAVFYRHVLLADALGTSVQQVLGLLKLAGRGKILASMTDAEEVIEQHAITSELSIDVEDLAKGLAQPAWNATESERAKGILAAVAEVDSSKSSADFLYSGLGILWGIEPAQLKAIQQLFGRQNLWSDNEAKTALKPAPGDSPSEPFLMALRKLERCRCFVPTELLAEAETPSILRSLVAAGVTINENAKGVRCLVKAAANLPVFIQDAVRRGVSNFDFWESFKTLDDEDAREKLFSQSTALLGELVGAGWPLLSDDPLEKWNQLADRVVLSKATLLNGTQLRVCSDANDKPKLGEIVELLEDQLRSRKGKQVEEIIDRLKEKRRENERDVLLGVLMHAAATDRQMKTATAWYERLLIDVERGGCASTTLVAAKISTVQLYLDRIKTGQEAQFDTSYITESEWNYRDGYRRWEAARKLYLHPENHLHPDLRDDKTEAYVALEDELLQQKITSHAALRAYHAYVRRFHELASLQPVGACAYGENEERQIVIIGVTPSDPPRHYIQTYWPAKQRWSPWAEVGVSIPVRDASPIITGNGTLFLYWVTHNTQAKTHFIDGTNTLTAYQHDVQYQYAERYADGSWSQGQRVEIDFEPLGYGGKNTLADRFAQEAAIKSQINDSGSDIVLPLTSLLLDLDPPLKLKFETENAGDFELEFSKEAFHKKVRDLLEAGAATRFHALMKGWVPLLFHEFEAELEVGADGAVEFAVATLGDSLAAPSISLVDTFRKKFSELPDRLRAAAAEELGIDATAKPIPLFDIEPHYEQSSTYHPHRYGWSRAFPEPAGEGRGTHLVLPGDLTRPGSRFTRMRLRFVTRTVEQESPLNSVKGSPWLRLNSTRRAVRAFSANAAESIQWLRPYPGQKDDSFAGRAWFADAAATEFGTDLITAHGGVASSTPDRSALTTIVSIKASASDVQLQPICNAAGDGVLTVDGQSFLLLQQASGKWSLVRIGSTLADKIANHFSDSLEFALGSAAQSELEEAQAPFFKGVGAEEVDRLFEGELPFDGPMGAYLAELYFHIPYAIANHLNAQGEFEEAQRWFGYLYNPMAVDSAMSSVWPSRFLQTDVQDALFTQTGAAVDLPTDDPFNPYATARKRRSAFQRAVVLRSFDNLLDLADSLFSRFQREPVEDALRIYLQVQGLIGERPYQVGGCGETGPSTFGDLGTVEGALGALIELVSRYLDTQRSRTTSSTHERFIARATTAVTASTREARRADRAVYVRAGRSTAPSVGVARGRAEPRFARSERDWRGTSRRSISSTTVLAGTRTQVGAFNLRFGLIKQLLRPVFCVPSNPAFDALWDRLENRIFNLRNCRDINGVRREMPAFAPPIDLSALTRAGLAGADLALIAGGSADEIPPYRFSYLIEKAKAWAVRVQDLGAKFQSAKERYDGETMQRLKNDHEKVLLDLDKRARTLEIESAKSALQGAEARRLVIAGRQAHYAALLDTGLLPLEIAQQAVSLSAQGMRFVAGMTSTVSAVLHLIPEIGSPFALKFGGAQMGESQSGFSQAFSIGAAIADASASVMGMLANHERRAQDWSWQVEQAGLELADIDTQIAAARARLQVAEGALTQQTRRIEQAAALRDFHRDKFSNIGLYTWMSKQLSGLHRTAYEGALRVARMAEKAFEHELGIDYTGTLQSDWLGAYGGLLSGERLLNSLHDLEEQYLKANVRQQEITQSFSFAQLFPLQLKRLNDGALSNDETSVSSGDFKLLREFFDLVYPGHYHRIIRDVRISIPAVVGPQVNVGAELIFKSSTVRRLNTEDGTFSDKPVMKAPAERIATSSARADGGRFELSFRDERFAPFEGAGATSTWELRLPKHPSFDYRTISDAVVTVSYTSKHDESLRETANADVASWLGGTHQAGFWLRRSFPEAWQALASGQDATVELRAEMFPYFILQGGDFVASVDSNSNLEVENGRFLKLPASLYSEDEPDVRLEFKYERNA